MSVTASLQLLEQEAWLQRAPVGWVEVEEDLDARGFAVIKNLLRRHFRGWAPGPRIS